MLVVAGLAYVVAKGISIMAATIGPGWWGYVGAAGFLAVVGPLPFVLLGLFGRRGWLVMAVGSLTIAVASVGVARHWSGWSAGVWLAAVLLSCIAVREILSLPARMTRRRAVKLLRRQRGTGKTDAWSLRDWEWAYTQLGTPLAIEQAAWYRWLQTGPHGDPRKTTP